MFSFHRHLAFRLSITGLCVLTLIVATSVIVREPSISIKSANRVLATPPIVEDELVPQHREPPPPPPPAPPAPPPSPKPKPPKPAPPAANVDVYRGLGAWVDIYDSDLEPVSTIDEMARRGVKTLYLETNNYHSAAPREPTCQNGPDVGILHPEIVTSYLDRAHQKGIAVVAWYVPGFADLDRDIRRSLDAINFRTAAGNKFDGFAPDIEARGEFYCKGVTGDEVRTRFNAGIIEYTTKLRAQVGAAVLGGIVVDAKNNERAPAKWAGFPWPEIGKHYDVIMPMAYWTASPSNSGCPGADIDVRTYMHEVVDKTQKLTGTAKPMHLIGGVADCISQVETAGHVLGAKDKGSIGVSLYDYKTMQSRSVKDTLWSELAKFIP